MKGGPQAVGYFAPSRDTRKAAVDPAETISAEDQAAYRMWAEAVRSQWFNAGAMARWSHLMPSQKELWRYRAERGGPDVYPAGWRL